MPADQARKQAGRQTKQAEDKLPQDALGCGVRTDSFEILFLMF